ncbi:hypothetical protein NWF34_01140 [Gordonia sp. GONU]|uniref:hypothetical protein n=1 Tax=Gordonia TaxID=2053 RepID=UPI0021ABAA1C|nr:MULTISPECIES: hypothetical protein [Gordonia]MCR8895555.1 hypothetical protein [Gordonia sp. GONU]MCZ4651293.1 hypothetical protein [Gordonia amicalis]
MAVFAWTQDVPIDAEMYGEIAQRIGDTPMPGLIVHLAIENADKTVSYLDVWDSEESCFDAMEKVVHPAVRPVLAAHGVNPPGEPPRTPATVLEVRFADGAAVGP